MKQEYVCGFLFSEKLHYVVLIWKEKPSWQKGSLNGIGGKIENGETPAQAMQREFKEETGVDVEQWQFLIALSGEDWIVHFFCTKSGDAFEDAQTMEDEEVAKIEVETLDHYQHITNLKWLVPMAIYKLKNPVEIMSI